MDEGRFSIWQEMTAELHSRIMELYDVLARHPRANVRASTLLWKVDSMFHTLEEELYGSTPFEAPRPYDEGSAGETSGRHRPSWIHPGSGRRDDDLPPA